MGNCQAAEAATVVIQHPSGRVERVYWSLSANQVMAANPGHYVAIVITSTSNSSDSQGRGNNAPVKLLKLLRPDDTLHIGRVYRLVSFEDVLNRFASKRQAKLSRLLYEQKDRPSSRKAGSGGGEERRQSGGGDGGLAIEPESSPALPQEVELPVRAEVEFEELVQKVGEQWKNLQYGGGRRPGAVEASLAKHLRVWELKSPLDHCLLSPPLAPKSKLIT